MAVLQDSAPGPLSGSAPCTQDEEAMDSILQEVDLSFRKSPPATVSGRRFTAEAEDLSTPFLGQGFQYQTKPPNPPGQFAGRPAQPVLSGKQYSSKPGDLKSAQKSETKGQSKPPPKEPLVLPELAFSPPTQVPDQTSPHFRESGSGSSSSAQVFKTTGTSGDSLPKLSESAGAPPCEIVTSDREGTSEVLQDSPYSTSPPIPAQITARNSQKFRALSSKVIDDQSWVRSTPFSVSPTAAVEKSSSAASSRSQAAGSDMTHKAVKVRGPLNIAPHILRQSEPHRSSSPTSACGDLEKPFRRPRSTRGSKSPRGTISRPLPCGGSPSFYGIEGHVRSQSRASNVSKKRLAVNKPPRQSRSQRCPDRRAMMQEMATQWNEYLLAADRDKEEYRMEVEALQHDIDVQAVQLEKAAFAIQQRDKSLAKMQEKCAELQKKQDTVSAARDQLGEQVEGLRKELNTNKDQTEATRERNSACRKKVNEAISEHQKLFKLTKSYCADLQQQLDSEKKQRTDQVHEVQHALQKSHVQRKAMKDFACFVEKEMLSRETLKDDTISALRSRIAEQNQTLARVTFLEKSLNTQLKAQQATQHSVDELHKTLGAFGRVYDRDSDARALQSAAVDMVVEKLHSISDSVQCGASNALTKEEAADFFSSLQSSVVSSMNGITGAVAANEEGRENRVRSFEQTLNASLATLKQELEEQLTHIQRSSTSSVGLVDGFHARFDQLEAKLRQTQTAAELVEKRLDSLMSDGAANAMVASSKLNEALAKPEKRDNKISELKRQLQLVTEDYNTKVEEMRRSSEVSEANRHMGAQQFTTQLDEMSKTFEAQLDFALAQQREECEVAMREEQTDHWTAENSLKEAREKLEILTVRSEKTHALEEKLETQERLVKQLKEQIVLHEQQVEAHKKLSQRWHQDIEAVDKLRSQLKSVVTNLPQMEAMGYSLERIVRVHDFLNSTAEYLVVEQDWVQNQLQSRKPLLPGTEQNPEAGVAGSEKSTNHRDVGSRGDTSRSLGTSQKELDRRRVVVQSPSGSIGSPSPPPSVEQERKRRRAGFETQSILRLSATTPTLPQTQVQPDAKPAEPRRPDRGLFDLMKGHSRYFRPITSTAAGAAPAANSGIVEQIRASLVQNQGVQWSLPTLADFERPLHTQPACVEEDVREPTEGRIAKRIKIET